LSWVAVAIGGAAVVGAAGSAYASNQASDASVKGTKQALAEQQRQFNIGLNLYEPQRSLGYGAMSDLASLYGYNLAPYQSSNQLLYGNTGQPITVKGNAGGGGGGGGGLAGAGLGGALGAFAGPVGMVAGGLLGSALGGGGEKKVVGGVIDPTSGTVDAQGGTAGRDPGVHRVPAHRAGHGEPERQGAQEVREPALGH
jgi:hypothetical protein